MTALSSFRAICGDPSRKTSYQQSCNKNTGVELKSAQTSGIIYIHESTACSTSSSSTSSSSTSSGSSSSGSSFLLVLLLFFIGRRAVFQLFEVPVQKEANVWPEKHKRGRQWMAYREAKQAFVPRPNWRKHWNEALSLDRY